MSTSRHAAITGTGSYVPSRVVSNAELERLLGTSVEPFVSETLGIRECRFAAPKGARLSHRYAAEIGALYKETA